MNHEFALAATGVGAVAWLLPAAWRRLQLSLAKHPSLAGHSRMAKRVARWVPGYAYDEAQCCAADGAGPEVVARRRAGLDALGQSLRRRAPQTLALTDQAREGLSDLQLTGRYRVPFPFAEVVRQRLPLGAFWAHAGDGRLHDLDGNAHLDLTGSYGVNVFGLDFYKECMAEGSRLGETLGPVLGGYHPCVAEIVRELRAISGQDEVSFHMSGTEAVMQAVRLARYHSGRRHLVRFCGSYHGWWEDVQPGPGNPLPPRETYTLKDMDEDSLRVLRTRRDIACVLVNPLQALHPNRNAPGDSTLVDGSRRAGFDREAYTAWLRRLREVCTERGIALIFDEVFVGFRLALGGAQAFFGVQADLVCYGKTLGGGFPVGVVCGQRAWMRRFRPERPADLCLARGTFNAHPYVMGAMHAFLQALRRPEVAARYEGLEARWDAHLARFNQAMSEAGLPVEAAALSSIWTLGYTRPSRYHWMYQFYLRDEGVALSWVGTGRLIFTLDLDGSGMDEVIAACLRAGRRMQADGWWWHGPGLTHARIRRGLAWEMLKRRVGWRDLSGDARPTRAP